VDGSAAKQRQQMVICLLHTDYVPQHSRLPCGYFWAQHCRPTIRYRADP